MKSKGFTLIELIIVMVLLSILVAVAVPKYQNLTSQGTAAMQKGLANAVKSTWAIYIAQNTGAYPTVTALATAMNTVTAGTGPGCRASTSGILCTLGNGSTATVTAYKDTACATGVTAVSDTAQCIGI